MGPAFSSTIGHPGWLHYLAFDDHTPIAAAALRTHEQVAWCCFAGTIPSHRRRGAQGAMLARRISDAAAAAAGCTWVTCESVSKSSNEPSQSLRNMQRAGFKVAYARPSYVLDLATA
jgi:hypothetical protein